MNDLKIPSMLEYLILLCIDSHKEVSVDSLKGYIKELYDFKSYTINRAINKLHKEKHYIKQIVRPVITPGKPVTVNRYFILTSQGADTMNTVFSLIQAVSK